ncbi:MAG TPA: PQQ-binding-like beta-propeller repeat protein [Vicinamibacterales bacterium]|nr:PQQ-binding-like beta-propeller repeat protein [Vicinamibacterales bacterium]
MSTTRYAAALATIAIAAAAGWWSAAARAQQPGASAPYTEQQAAAGQAAYAQSCAGCHGRTLSGAGEAPPLAGAAFMGSWGSHTTGELFNRIRLSMPPENPDGLSAETYASIAAFLLKANGAQPGPNAFTPGTNVSIGSVATGVMPAGLNAVAGVQGAGRGRGRGGRGRGGDSEDSAVEVAPRRGLTVPGNIASYSPITDDMMAHPPDGDWLMHYRNYAGWSNSPLTQITPKNAGLLQLRWAWPLDDGARQQITPLVHDGVMFLSTNMTNTVQALDGRTGDLLWENRIGPIGSPGLNATRTMALYGNLLFYPSTDTKLYALDARTGKVVWQIGVSQNEGDKIGGMMVVHGKVIIGLTRCDEPSASDHCFIAAYDANTGKEVWKFYTIARTGTPGGDSWGNLPDDKRSGADAWITGTYDPLLNLMYWGTGQPKGAPRSERGNAAALFTSTTLALDPDTGQLKWYYQNAPGEALDLDEVFERVLIDHGPQKTLMTVGKSGLLWKLDRVAGKFVDVKETVFQNVWQSIDMKTGRTTYRDDILEQKPGQAVASCPSPEGGHNWTSSSYSPADDLLVIPLSQTCAMMGAGGQLFYEMPGSDGNLGRISAYETNTMRPVWTFQQRTPFLTGVMTTAGGVGFVGDFNRVFRAFDLKTGKTLWQTRLPTTAQGYPVTFSVGGDQFVAVPTGYNGGSPEQKPTTMLRGELNRPLIGHGVYVFGLPKASAE